MMRFVDVLYAIPFVFFDIVLMTVVQFDDPVLNLVLIFCAIGAVEWLTMARIVRGQTLSLRQKEFVEAARAAGHYIPYLCWHPDFPPHGSCKLCVVKVGGRHVSSCALPAKEGMEVESNTPEINAERRAMLQMLFVEGNHFCPSCEKSGNCQLQALAYELEMTSARFNHIYSDRPVDASHPGVSATAPTRRPTAQSSLLMAPALCR